MPNESPKPKPPGDWQEAKPYNPKPSGTWNQARTIDRFCLVHGFTALNWYELLRTGGTVPPWAKHVTTLINRGLPFEAAIEIRKYASAFHLKDDPNSTPKPEPAPPWEPPESDNVPPPDPIPGLDIPTPTGEFIEEGKDTAEKPPSTKDNGMNAIDTQMRALRKEIEKLKKLRETPSYTTMSKDYIKPEYFNQVCDLIKHNTQVLLFGEPGTGKSRTAREVAKSLKLEFFSISFAGGMRYAQVFGAQSIKDGDTHWKTAPFLANIQKKGLTLMDEIYSVDPQIGNGMLSILEPSQAYFTCPLGTIKVHPEHRFIATANVSGREISNKHTGTFRSDDALSNRFQPIRIKPSPKVENALLTNLIDPDSRKYIKESLKLLRSSLRKSEIKFDATTRHLIRCIQFINQMGMQKEAAFKLVFLETLSKAELHNVGGV